MRCSAALALLIPTSPYLPLPHPGPPPPSPLPLPVPSLKATQCTLYCTYCKPTLGDNVMCGLCDVSCMYQVVVRVLVFTVALLQLGQEVFQGLSVYLQIIQLALNPSD